MRIAVVGTTGSGKTTLAKALATQLLLPYIDAEEAPSGELGCEQPEPPDDR